MSVSEICDLFLKGTEVFYAFPIQKWNARSDSSVNFLLLLQPLPQPRTWKTEDISVLHPPEK